MPFPLAQHHKRILIALSVVSLLLYAAFNVWLFRANQKKSAPANQVSSQQPNGLPNGLLGNQGSSSAPKPNPQGTPTSAPLLPTPTPRPTGPGRYACDPNGICGDYSEEMRASCPVTFADRLCLDSCGDTAKRCKE